MAFALLTGRMIQNFSESSGLEYHWGYASRQVPCLSDPGSCEYLDIVYSSHDLGMLLSGVFWAAVGGILLIWGLGRRLFPAEQDPDVHQQHGDDATASRRKSLLRRLGSAVVSTSRSYLLPTSIKSIFGHTTRLQVLILAILSIYLIIWTFAGMAYKQWLTPIKNQPATVFNTRTTLGPWSDRIGIVAYALTPLSILLCSRESLLSVITGVPYTSFLFLHKWVGHLIFAQSMLHTIGWVIIEANLYRPQPSVWQSFIASAPMQWGFVALGFLVLLWAMSFSWVIKHVTGYEFFRKTHYVLAMMYIGGVIAHWSQLQAFLVPGLVLWFVDRGARLVRTAMLHYSSGSPGTGFSPARASAHIWKDKEHGNLVRLDFAHSQAPWAIGQHFYLCFLEGSIWQSHPMTPLSMPTPRLDGKVLHSYLFRAKKGETKRIATLLETKSTSLGLAEKGPDTLTTPVILTGPYGENSTEGLTSDTHVLCIAGGTGITYVLPVLLKLAQERQAAGRKIELVWAVRREQDLEWIKEELSAIRNGTISSQLSICIFVTDGNPARHTRPEQLDVDLYGAQLDVKSTAFALSHPITSKLDGNGSSSSSNDGDTGASVPLTVHSGTSADSFEARRPHVSEVVQGFVADVAAGPTVVFVSGPLGMIDDARKAVARCNSGFKVWKGESRYDVKLRCDDRLEG